MKKTLLIIIYICITLFAYAKSIPEPKNEFLFKIDNTQAQGMGNATVALSSKYGIVTNPASLTELKENHLIFTYNVSDYRDLLSKDEVTAKGSPSGLYYTMNAGGIYIRNLADGKEKSVYGEKNHKYNFDLKEIGIGIAQKSDTVQGLSTGLNLKLFLGHILDAKISDNGIIDYLNTDRGVGAGLDFGLMYKKEYLSLGFNWSDIFSRVWWSKYSPTTINGTLNFGMGLDFNFIRYGVSARKVLLSEYPFEFGSGLEFVVLALPKEYSFFLLKEGRLTLRTGVYGENIIEEKKDYHYGAELSNNKGFMDLCVISQKTNMFESPDDNIYKMSLGLNF